jgi:antiviral helicase SKI2
MLARSFAEFHAQRSVGDRRGELAIDNAALRKVESLIQAESQQFPQEWSKAVAWDEHARAIAGSVEYVQEAIMTSRGAQNALTPGRIVLVAPESEGGANLEGLPRGGVAKHCVLLRVVSTATSKSFIVLAPCPEGHSESTSIEQLGDTASSEPRPLRKDDDDDDFFGMSKKSKRVGASSSASSNRMPEGLPWFQQAGGIDFIIANVPERAILAITTSRLSVEADEILDDKGAPAPTSRALLDLEKVSAETTYEALHPIKDLKLQDIATVEACQHHAELVKTLPAKPVASAQKLREWSALLHAKHILTARVSELEFGLSDANLLQMPDFENRVTVLQRMGYLDENRTVTLKGRVACEIATGDELVGTEIIFAGVLADVPAAEAVALLASLVFQEKNASPPTLQGSLKVACDRAKELAFTAGEIQAAQGIQIAPDEFVETTMRFGLSEVVYEWAKGTPFSDICQFTDVQEGSIVRTIVRLDEMCRDVRNAARIMGDSILYAKMEEASAAIKRDIVFSASLYVAGAT